MNNPHLAFVVFCGVLTMMAAECRAEEPLLPPNDQVADVAYSMEHLAGLSWKELECIYRQAGPGKMPSCGRFCGRAVFCSSQPCSCVYQALANCLWRGKFFASSEVINQWRCCRAIRGKVYPGESWLDGNPSVILDYRPTSLLWRNIRDEMRQVGPGLYLGMMYREPCCCCCCGTKQVVSFFILQASDCNCCGDHP